MSESVIRMTMEELQDLGCYLLSHESDIYEGINDYSELRSLFRIVIGREPKD